MVNKKKGIKTNVYTINVLLSIKLQVWENN
jgi:hypothetical protein